MRAPRRGLLAGLLVLVSLSVFACGDAATGTAGSNAADGGLRVVATTSIVGDVVAGIVGDAGTVEVLMGPGADPHTFSPSAAQAAAVRDADVVVAIGMGLEESLLDLLQTARESGVEVVELATLVDTIPIAEGLGHDHAGEEEGAHDDDPQDPHIWFDPSRIATAVEALAPTLVANLGDGAVALVDRAEAYAADLRELDAELEAILATIPEERRVLVTNHDAVGYLAHRYDLRLVGTVVPGGSTMASASAERIAELAGLLEELEVPAIFAENTTDDRLARSLAREVGEDIEVVSLYTDALGPEGSGAETYAGMLRTDAQLIADALTR